MTRPRLLDTNLIVRHLVQDHEKQSKAAGALFAACDRGEVTLLILPEVLAECVCVLESFYKHPRAEIARVLSHLLKSPGVEVAGSEALLDALARYGRGRVHYVDCVIAATAARRSISVASFDTDLAKFGDVRVELD